MPKVVDPDQLNEGTEIVIDTTGPKTVQLLAAGNLSNASPAAVNGVSMQAVYSKGVLLWESTLNYRRHSFPLKAYTPNEMEWINSWGPDDATTRELIRDAGWIETDGREVAGILSLGDIAGDTDQAYFAQAAGGNATVVNFVHTGELNEGVDIIGAGGTPVNTSYLGVYGRTRPNFYDFFELVAGLQLSQLDPKLYSIPFATSPDPNISESDANIDTLAPYTGMTLDYLTGATTATTWAITTVYAAGDVVASSGGRYFRCTVGGTSAGNDSDLAGGSDTGVTWEVHPGERQIGSTYYFFTRILDGNSGTLSEIYQWGARQERQTGDINDNVNLDAFGVVKGQLAEHLFAAKAAGFDGTKLTLAEGVFVDSPDAAEANNLVFVPHALDTVLPGQVQFPFTVNLKFLLSANLVPAGTVTVFFANDDPPGANLGNDFDTDNAIVVDDDVAADMDFTAATAEVNKTYDYDVNNQRGGASAGTDAPIKVVALNPGFAEPIVVDATITRVDNVDIRVNALDDRNFANP